MCYNTLIKNIRLMSSQPDKLINVKDIIKEWSFTGQIREETSKNAYLTCLCSYSFCKTLYEIKNIHNGNETEVGSKCIEKFIKKFDDDDPWKGKEQIKKIVNERNKYKNKIFKEHQLKKYNIEEKEYYIKWENSVFKVKVKAIGNKCIKISYSLFGNNKIGKHSIPIENFKQYICTVEEYNDYMTLKEEKLNSLDLYIGDNVQGRKIKDIYCNKNNIWVILFTDKTSNLWEEFKSNYLISKKEMVLSKLNILLLDVNQYIRNVDEEKIKFEKFSYVVCIEEYLERYHKKNIASITNPLSSKMLFNAKKWRQSKKQFIWIEKTLKKLKSYIRLQ